MIVYYVGDELYHHGIEGQKWGIRRYQNPDGTLTELGRLRYAKTNRELGRYGKYVAKKMDKAEKAGRKLEDKEPSKSKVVDLYRDHKAKKINDRLELGASLLEEIMQSSSTRTMVLNEYAKTKGKSLESDSDASRIVADVYYAANQKTVERIMKNIGSDSVRDLKKIEKRVDKATKYY